MQYKSTYIYQIRNLMLRLWENKWRKGAKGLFFLVGKTDSGKTEFLKCLEEKVMDEKDGIRLEVGWYTSQDVTDSIVCKINGQSDNVLSMEEDIIIIENVEDLSNKQCSRKEVMELLEKLSDTKTIICTSTVLLPEMEKHKVINIHKAKIDRHFVKKMVCVMLDNELSGNDMKTIIRMRFKSVSALKGALRKKALEREMCLKE